jgi:hypothetical protein
MLKIGFVPVHTPAVAVAAGNPMSATKDQAILFKPAVHHRMPDKNCSKEAHCQARRALSTFIDCRATASLITHNSPARRWNLARSEILVLRIGCHEESLSLL